MSDAPPTAGSAWSLAEVLRRLPRPATAKWPQGVFDTEVWRSGGVSLSLFAPRGHDFQTAHDQDEIYVVVAGQGRLQLPDRIVEVGPGDAVQVPSGVPHRFVQFSDDFATWVLFFDATG